MFLAQSEIAHQSGSLSKTWAEVLSRGSELKALLSHEGDVVLVACGSSFWLSLSAQKTLALATGHRTFAVKAGDIVLGPEEYEAAYRRPLLIMPSRSGATTEQLEALTILRRAYPGAPMLALVEYELSALEAQASMAISLPWANEESICQTRSFSNLYLALVAIAALFDDELKAGMERYLSARPGLEARDFPLAGDIVRDFPQLRHVMALGSGRQYGVTVEGAYICVEMAQMVCGYYGLLEYRHGPIVTADSGTLAAICSKHGALQYEEKMAGEAKAAGAKVLSVVMDGGHEGADWRISLGGQYPPEAVALHFVFVMQALAFHAAVSRGLDPDHPGDLMPYITL